MSKPLGLTPDDILDNMDKEIYMVTITEKEYKNLLDNKKILESLKTAGVDNWEGYHYAMELYNGS